MPTSSTTRACADAAKTPNPDHDELVLLARLTSTNTQIANYVSRVLDLDRGSTEYTKSLAEVERELGKSLLAMGHSVMARVRDPRRPTTTHRQDVVPHASDE